MEISVVIISLNEERQIADCISSAKQVAHDIIVVDTGSCDQTIAIARSHGATVIPIDWRGYGNARNTGATHAQYNWILSLDADERITQSLAREINGLKGKSPDCIYGFRRNNYMGSHRIHYGAIGREKVFRLYHRRLTQWDMSPVHEKIIASGLRHILLQQPLEHFGIDDLEAYTEKKKRYAALCAYKYQQEGKRAAWFFRYVSPVFYFVKSYFVLAGFMDGKRGFLLARVNAQYTADKYSTLSALLEVDKQYVVQLLEPLQSKLSG